MKLLVAINTWTQNEIDKRSNRYFKPPTHKFKYIDIPIDVIKKIEDMWCGDPLDREAAYGWLKQFTGNERETAHGLLMLTVMQSHKNLYVCDGTYIEESIESGANDKYVRENDLIRVITRVYFDGRLWADGDRTYLKHDYDAGIHRNEMVVALLEQIKYNVYNGGGEIRLIKWKGLQNLVAY